jgi:hypothetical protein
VAAEQTGKENQMTVTNNDRAEWAAAALRHFQCTTGTDYDDALTDLLCDLHHWCDRGNANFQSALDRARQHYDAECAEDSTTPYVATFNIPAGTAREIFHAKSPEEAFEQARKFADNDSLTEADFEPSTEGYCIREITIADEHGQQHCVWQTDEYRLQLAAPNLLEALEEQTGAAQLVIDAWAKGDLARAVNGLESSLGNALAEIAEAKGGVA